MKHLLLSAAFCCALGAQAQGKSERWLNPEVNRVNTVKSRSTFFAYENERAARFGNKYESDRYMSLEGNWKFFFVKDHNLAPKGFYAPGYDDSAWDLFPVPGLFEINGYGDRIYKNVGYAWATVHQQSTHGWREEQLHRLLSSRV